MKIATLIKRIFFGVIIFLGIAFISFVIVLKLNYVPPVLMYHSINTEPGLLTVKPAIFEKQMKFLHDHKYNVVYIYEIAGMVKNKQRIPPKTVAVTFDDGYEDNFINAFPILKKYKIPATFFIIVDYINKSSYITADQLKVLAESNIIDIGSHSQSHLWLSKTEDENRWKKEILESKNNLEKLLDRKVRSFCYPGGDGVYIDRIRQTVKEAGYEVGVCTNPGKGFPNNDIYALKRLKISNKNNLFAFWFKLTGSYSFLREFNKSKEKWNGY